MLLNRTCLPSKEPEEEARRVVEVALLEALLSPICPPICSIYELEEKLPAQLLAFEQAIEGLKLVGIIRVDGATVQLAGAARATAALLQEQR